LGDSDKALADLARAIEIDPKAASGLLNRAFLYERLGKLELAIADYDRLIALGEDDDFYKNRRAELLEKLGKPVSPPGEPGKPQKAEAAETPSQAPAAEKKEPPAEANCRSFLAAVNMTIAIPCPP
jgi:tetratricopeptide (TPR) repeat protein